MPNNLHVEAIVWNSTDVFYFKHPNTAVYTAGTPKPSATGTFVNDFTGVRAGNYGPVDPSVPAANVLTGTLGPPSATNTTTYTYVGEVRPVVDAAPAPSPAPTGNYAAATTKTYPSASSFAYEAEGLVVREQYAPFNSGASQYIIQNRSFNKNALIHNLDGTITDKYCLVDAYMPSGALIIFRNCVFASDNVNDMIHVTDGTRIRLENCLGYGTGNQPAGQLRGRFFYSYRAASVTLLNCYLNGTAGVKVDRWAGTSAGADTVKILNNRFDNVCGDNGGNYRQAVQLADVQGVAGLEIGWNQVVNMPGVARVEDIINIEESSGTASSRPSIHDNYLNGACQADPSQGGFTGSGITLEASGPGNPVSAMPAYWDIVDNIIVATMNAAINITAGLHNRATRNKIVVSGRQANGSPSGGVNNAIGLFNNSGYSNSQMDDNAVTGNEVHINTANGENGYYNNGDTGPNSVPITTANNTFVDGATYADEQAAFTAWQNRLSTQQILIGA